MESERQPSIENFLSLEVGEELEEQFFGGAEEIGHIPVDDGISLHFRQMSSEPLLSAQLEVELARQIEKGRQAAWKMRESNGDLPETEKAGSTRLVQEGRLARKYLARANERYVVKVAKRYRAAGWMVGLRLDDLIGEGNLGLMRAVDLFDYRLGLRFTTYATWWIEQRINRALTQKWWQIRLPLHVVEKYSEIKRLEAEIAEAGGTADPETIAQRVNGQRRVGSARVSAEAVKAVLNFDESVLSLDQELGVEGEGESLGEVVADEESLMVEEQVWQEQRQALMEQVLEQALEELSDPRMKEIVRLRWGLFGRKRLTLAEAGGQLGMSRERVRQLERDAKIELLEVLKKIDWVAELLE